MKKTLANARSISNSMTTGRANPAIPILDKPEVQVINRKVCEPLEEDSFRPILHHYDGPKFHLELSVSEALSLLDIFADQNSFNDIFKAIPA